VSGGFVASAVAVGALLALLGHHGGTPGVGLGKPAAAAIAYARAQPGKPYEWGGTGPAVFDCSGLVMRAYAAAGVSLARTSQEQWATEPHIPGPQPGDLVFFAGVDGTPSAPGHVGIVVDPSRHLMIDAYAAEFPVEYDTYGLASSKPGLSDPAGFAQPWGGT
jgi:cell wall-associated NlpC family hydrolase